ARLDQIAGVGYRKALEFIVKDFIIKGDSKLGAVVEKMQLGACIEKHITDTNLKACAKRAAWLGNDETHYLRKWEGKDIDDLKKLIRLTVSWVETNLLTVKF